MGDVNSCPVPNPQEADEGELTRAGNTLERSDRVSPNPDLERELPKPLDAEAVAPDGEWEDEPDRGEPNRNESNHDDPNRDERNRDEPDREETIRGEPNRDEPDRDATRSARNKPERAVASEREIIKGIPHEPGSIIYGDMVSFLDSPWSTACASHRRFTIKPRPFIVLSKGHGQHICFPLFTFGGQGLRYRSNVEEHVSILDCRPPIEAVDVAVQQSPWTPLEADYMRADTQRLHGCAAVCFSHPVSREYEANDEWIGRLSSSSLARLRDLVQYTLTWPDVEPSLQTRINGYKSKVDGLPYGAEARGNKTDLDERNELREADIRAEKTRQRELGIIPSRAERRPAFALADQIQPRRLRVKEPKVKEPEAKEPKAKEPKVKEPKVKQPKVKKAQAKKAKVKKPKVKKPKKKSKTVDRPSPALEPNSPNHPLILSSASPSPAPSPRSPPIATAYSPSYSPNPAIPIRPKASTPPDFTQAPQKKGHRSPAPTPEAPTRRQPNRKRKMIEIIELDSDDDVDEGEKGGKDGGRQGWVDISSGDEVDSSREDEGGAPGGAGVRRSERLERRKRPRLSFMESDRKTSGLGLGEKH